MAKHRHKQRSVQTEYQRDLDRLRLKWQEEQQRIPELRALAERARRSVRREFPSELIRTETDPFTKEKIYKNTDGTRATYHTRPIVVKRETKNPIQFFKTHVQTHVYFDNPLRVAVCRARKLRRRVLFALGLAGRGAGSGRGTKHNFTDTSRLRCG